MLDAALSAGAGDGADPAIYDSGGSKPALVLLHGIGGTWHIWKPVLGLLESCHRVIAITLPGHQGGPDYAMPGKAAVAGLTEQVIAMLRARGIHHAHVAGNSLGGWLAIELARRGFARSVVALSPAGGWCSAEDYSQVARSFRIVMGILPVLMFLTWWLLGLAFVRRLLGRKTMEHAERMPAKDFRDSLQAMSKTVVLPQLLDTMGRDGPVIPFRPTVPVTIAWSGRDRVIPYDRYGRTYATRVEGANESFICGVGHVPMYDNPQRVAAEIISVTVAGPQSSPQPEGSVA
jgi:pimeloyl-ACP methyl ester carboxylesterase